MTPALLARLIQDFLADAHNAVVLEDGEEIFDFVSARYSVSAERGKCLLHLWSAERNAVRRVLEAEARRDVLQLTVQRFGQARPSKLEICRERDRRAPSQRKAARSAYQSRLRRLLERNFSDFKLERLSSTMDLERSFGPAYTRGLLRRGRTASAVLGVNAQETQGAIDGALTIGLLWLDHCRQQLAGRAGVKGLKLFLPAGCSVVVRERMAHLDHNAAHFELFELSERDDSLQPLDTADRGNIATRLIRCPDSVAARERFCESVARVMATASDADVMVLDSSEIAFRLRGLEFARARLAPQKGSFHNVEEIAFGAGPYEAVLSDDNSEDFAGFVRTVSQTRRPGGPRDHALWRMQPERWLESLVVSDVRALDSRFDSGAVYSQVPAFAASDRAMIDVLTVTRDGQLAVLELKADEDLHLPLQGLDYWARVNWHHQRGEFQRLGYFPGRELSAHPPMLVLVAPALRVHPATDALLRYLSPEIDCTLLGIDERWREGVRVIFRKRRTPAADLRG
ncbi:MAG: hypothetical protein L0212_08840 [Acidobacteria bacterium]|nr:hypothetical protein [Acidobacteriota bacterium]